jgi:hypothetical protein
VRLAAFLGRVHLQCDHKIGPRCPAKRCQRSALPWARRVRQRAFGFCGAKESVRRERVCLARRFSHENGRGALTYNPLWKKRAAFIAMQFYKPAFVSVASGYGWSQEKHSFIFPTYRINIPGGKVYDNQYSAPPTSTSPALCLPRPGTLDPTELQSLIKSPEWPTILAALACVLHNLIAPLYQLPRLGVFIVGPHSVCAMSIFKKLGCAEMPGPVKTLKTISNDHGWLAVVPELPKLGKEVAEWLVEAEHNIVVPVARELGLACATGPGWHVLKASRTVELEHAAIVKLVPNFLQYICANRYPVRQAGNATTIDYVFALVVAWLRDLFDLGSKKRGDSRFGLHRARKLLDPSGCPGREMANLASLLCGGVERGLLGLAHRKPGDYNRYPELITLEQGLWIAQRVGRILWPKFGDIVLDPARITDILRSAGELLGKEYKYGQAGWVVSTEWWKKHLEAWRQNKNKLLRMAQ